MPMRIIYLRHRTAPPLGGCRWCGQVVGVHRVYDTASTWTLHKERKHRYEPPTTEQVRARFRARQRREMIATCLP